MPVPVPLSRRRRSAQGLVVDGGLLFEGTDVGEGFMVAVGSVVRGLKVPLRVLVAGSAATVRRS